MRAALGQPGRLPFVMTAQTARRPPARGGTDASHVVVIILAVGVFLGLISFLLPSGAGSHPPNAPAAEGKVFQGRRYKYHLRSPPGGVWRVTPDILLPPQALEADLTIDRAGRDVIVTVIAREMKEGVPLDEVLAN